MGIPFRIHVRRVFDVVRLVSTHYSHILVPFSIPPDTMRERKKRIFPIVMLELLETLTRCCHHE